MGFIDSIELWNNCLKEIEVEVSKANFSTWFKNTSIIKEDSGIIFIGVPNEFVKDWLTNKYHKQILKALMSFTDSVRAVEYQITKIDSKHRVGEESSAPKVFVNKELPLSDLYINKEDNLNPKYTFETFIVGPFHELA